MIILLSILWACCVVAAVLYIGDAIRHIRYMTLADGRLQERRMPILIRLLLPLTPNVMPFLRAPFFEKTLKKVERTIVSAGYENVIFAEELVSLQFLSALTGLLGGYAGLSVGMSWMVSGRVILLMTLILTVLGYFYPLLWLQQEKAARHKQIERALPHVLDLLTLSVEAGLDFMAGLRRIVDRRRLDPLGEELLRLFQEIKVGKTRRQGLRDLSQRVDNSDLTIVSLALIQADELGVGLGTVLRIQADQMRQRRFQRAEKAAHEAPVKMLLPLVVFIFPVVLIILGGPFLLQVFRSGVIGGP
jgi:tight adherence protein C